MCELCNGTRIVHEFTSFGYKTTGCEVCGPVSDEEWREDMESMMAEIDRKILEQSLNK